MTHPRRTVLAAALGAAAAAATTGTAAAGGGQSEKRFVKRRLKAMSLQEKVGQLFTVYAYGRTADTTDAADVAKNQETHGVDNAAELIATYKVGGIIYFAWSNNVANPDQITGLSNGLQAASTADGGEPLLIATDQEHGLVVRITAPATQLPGAMALGATHDTGAAYDAAVISGTELRAMGLNLNFAPDADVNVNPANPVIGVRSFGSDAAHVAGFAAAQVEGYQARGDLAATVKHFPGHGDTEDDSHTDLPQIDHTYEEWQEVDAPPFRAAIDAGVGAIMSAHIQFPALDPTLTPATLSKPILTGLLREELGYEGVIVTDSLAMEGVREGYGDDRIPVLALQAGIDMLLMPVDLDLAYNAVLNAVADGELTERRIDQSVTRILGLKYRLGLYDNPYADPDEVAAIVGTTANLEAAQALSDRTTTLVHNDGILPVPHDGGPLLVTGWGETTTNLLTAEFTKRGFTPTRVVTGIAPTQAQINAAVAAANGKSFIVVSTNGVADNPSQAALVKALAATGVPVVALGVRNPYDIAHLTEDVNAYLATYSYSADALESAVAAVLGHLDPQGRLPVDIPRADDPESVLYAFGHGLSYE
ncbi:glycoside hydrolase family 3 protein [Glycomyces algeriensis]|uniref:beta-N-acetylhexosaminidase n=1 Tax=Glycomyces algeriensis TaxID=256037 RepID=A0A9W6GBX5_9ACTN|nr:glycoside hydrolase family 3 protein [Glycomyces algeriensis]MDA1365469.1 glycoside hydrolase family 3 C-terminal domain-containing protein [Glycomyces algeriensis]MDR7351155.1 beta-N-acetylhexosaminidase [Glycomyces algeriensis]GLI43868.1 beta-N-acetylhexosaminidase [Glycomyces algeriensis]